MLVKDLINVICGECSIVKSKDLVCFGRNNVFLWSGWLSTSFFPDELLDELLDRKVCCLYFDSYMNKMIISIEIE